jgi:2-amino-4-hydroxy-6-hydroxymethyldihydropteridine diphosphokinase
MTRLYLLLGGNIGDKQKIFMEAREYLNNRVGKIQLQSAVYETEPWGFESPDLFWNQALEILTGLSPEEVLTNTQLIEQELGRIRKENRFSSRLIDIDILFYGDQILNHSNLVIPHPRIQERNFVLIPLCEIVPDLVHPVFLKSISQLLQECNDQLRVERVSDLPENYNS